MFKSIKDNSVCDYIIINQNSFERRPDSTTYKLLCIQAQAHKTKLKTLN